jgi:DNA-binding LacI/PurR family transcriptional regulator
VDDAGGAEAAAGHLLELGHRAIAIILLPPTRSHVGTTPTAARRLAGYQAALDRAGAPPAHTIAAAATMAAGAQAFATLAKGPRRPTAVLAMSDMAAIGLMSAAHCRPERAGTLSVVGCHDLPSPPPDQTRPDRPSGSRSSKRVWLAGCWSKAIRKVLVESPRL